MNEIKGKPLIVRQQSTVYRLEHTQVDPDNQMLECSLKKVLLLDNIWRMIGKRSSTTHLRCSSRQHVFSFTNCIQVRLN